MKPITQGTEKYPYLNIWNQISYDEENNIGKAKEPRGSPSILDCLFRIKERAETVWDLLKSLFSFPLLIKKNQGRDTQTLFD